MFFKECNVDKIQLDYVTNDLPVPVQIKIGIRNVPEILCKTKCLHFALINVNMYIK